MTFRPMKGATLDRITDVRLPCLASIKLDGIRGTWHGVEMLSSRLETLPNRAFRKLMADINLPAGRDGEIIWGEPNASDVYRRTYSALMTQHASADGLRFFIFDDFSEPGLIYPYRYQKLEDIFPHVIKLDQIVIDSYDQLQAMYDKALADGFEGLVLRGGHGEYKYGRSTLKQQWMLKLKPTTDAEAPVIGFEELMHNDNDLVLNNLGLAKRSSHQANKTPGNTLGALIVDWHGQPLRIGTFKGWSKSDLKKIWDNRDQYLGRLAKFKYFPIGIKDLPRQPRFIGWRAKMDT